MDSPTWTYHIALPQRYPTAYIGVWSDLLVAPSFDYSWDSISSLSGMLPWDFARDDLSANLENTLINGNRVEVYFNANHDISATGPDVLGKLIYSGYLTDYKTDLFGGGTRFTVQPTTRNAQQLRVSATVSGDTAKSVRDIITSSGLWLNWDTTNNTLSGVNYGVTFVDTPFRDAIEQLATATGDSWYSGLTPRGTLLFADTNTPGNTAHKLAIGYEVIAGNLGKSIEHQRRKMVVRYQTAAAAQTSVTATSSTFNAADPREDIVLLPGQNDTGNATTYANALLARAEKEYIIGDVLVSHQRYETASFELGHRVNFYPYRSRLPRIIAVLEPESAIIVINGIAWKREGVQLTLGLTPQSLMTIGATSARAAKVYLNNLL